MDLPYKQTAVVLEPSARLCLFSDGVFEIQKADGQTWSFDDFQQFLSAIPLDDNPIDCLLTHARSLQGPGPLADDFSMLEVTL